MGKSTVLPLFAHFVAPLIPEVAPPERRLPLRERMGWLLSAICVYLVCSQVPLFGITTPRSGDGLYWVRLILASNKGSLFELGLAPLMTSHMVIQILLGSGWLDLDLNNVQEKRLMRQLQQFLGIVLTLLQGIAYVLLGYYGPFSQLGYIRAGLIVAQLATSAQLLLLLEGLLLNGYGIGDGGANIFVALNVCERIFWQALSPFTLVVTTINSKTGLPQTETQFEGAIISFFHLLISRPNKFRALWEACFRRSGTNLWNLAVTAGIFFAVVYAQGFRVDLSVKSSRVRGPTWNFPVKLFYTSSSPIILLTALISNLYFFSEMLNSNYPGNFFVGLLGRWHVPEGATSGAPVGGLAYYLSPPLNLFSFLRDPLHAVFYTAFVLSTCALFARTWVAVSGNTAEDVAASLRQQGVVFKGHRESSMAMVLNRYIPAAAAFGGVGAGVLMIAADLLGAVGSGTGILLAVTIVHQYWETLEREKASVVRM